jgi:DNA (cytosine-5)-methyltransferase 1
MAKTPSPDAEGRVRLRNPGLGVGDDGDPMYTLQATKPHAVAFAQISSPHNYSNPQSGDPCHPLAAGAHPPAVAFQSSQSGIRIGDTHATLDANNGSRRHNGIATASAVRRLTPRECERLQGFPDDYTAIPWRKKGSEDCPDGPRYKALGNSMAVPVMHWIGERIAAVEDML